SIILGFRYKQINKDVPNAYEKQVYKVSEIAELDDLDFKINSYNIIKGEDKATNDNIILNIEIKNKSSQKINIKSLIFDSRLSDGFDYIDTASVDEKYYDDIEGGLDAGKVLKFDLHYSAIHNNISFDNPLQFYIPNCFYEKQIREKYNEKKFYAKYIELD
ncbi:MAG: DUF4352 domain-containing protein, partial [Clostridium sp.]|nr:DUF4352 domain-containing protein [Clostridium sp.]